MNRIDRLRLTPEYFASIELPPHDPSTEDATDGGELPAEPD